MKWAYLKPRNLSLRGLTTEAKTSFLFPTRQEDGKNFSVDHMDASLTAMQFLWVISVRNENAGNYALALVGASKVKA